MHALYFWEDAHWLACECIWCCVFVRWMRYLLAPHRLDIFSQRFSWNVNAVEEFLAEYCWVDCFRGGSFLSANLQT